MTSNPRKVVDEMFEAFGAGDVDGILRTVSEDSEWIYHGTHVIPRSGFRGREEVRAFFSNILERTEILAFEHRQYVVQGDTVVVLGSEHQRTNRSGRELKQEWVQVYTVDKGLIVRMEEFAATVYDSAAVGK